MNFKVILFFYLFILALNFQAQEIVTGLQRNEAVKLKYDILNKQDHFKNSSKANSRSITLPFFDDFETSSVFPNQDIWQGYSVFVNENFPYFPPNINAATFDALDSTGNVYGNAVWVPFEARWGRIGRGVQEIGKEGGGVLAL